jgi:hypothetical protein
MPYKVITGVCIAVKLRIKSSVPLRAQQTSPCLTALEEVAADSGVVVGEAGAVVGEVVVVNVDGVRLKVVVVCEEVGLKVLEVEEAGLWTKVVVGIVAGVVVLD